MMLKVKGLGFAVRWASVYPIVVYIFWNKSQGKSGHGFCNCQKLECRPTLERAACAWSSEKGRQEGERRLPYQTLARRRPCWREKTAPRGRFQMRHQCATCSSDRK